VTPERWAQIKRVVAEALETPVGQRAALLERSCGPDQALRQEVESLLAAAAGTDSLPEARGAIASVAKSVVSDRDSAHRSLLEEALDHEYEILRPLGRGGMGDVYLARERALERFVAIKVLRPDLAEAPESQERFRREARIVAQLSHPGILRLHTFGEVGGVWYFVMGYVRGDSLAERLRLEGRLPWVEAHRILTDLADALEYAHRHGVVHRDIKPANILLDDDSGHAVLADFGISKASAIGDSLTATGAVVGTPDYMSPEQAIGSSEVDERSDIYSLGAVAYTMLVGRQPFTGISTSEVMYRRLSHDPIPLQSAAPSVPEAFAAVVMRCLARERSGRWPDAQTLKQALGRVSGNSVETLPEGVRDLPSFGAYALLWVTAWTVFAMTTLRPPSERALLLLIGFLVPLGLMLHLWNVGRHGLGPLELARVASWPPEWWGMWWPRALRRPSDLWPRLPWQARLARGALSGFFVAVPGVIVLRQWLGDTGRLGSIDPTQQWFMFGEAAVVLGAAGIVAGALRWARGQGLLFGEVIRLLFGATTASPSWSAPRLARLLAPAVGRVRPPQRDDPADHHRAIVDLLPLLPAEAEDIGITAAAMAKEVLGAIAHRDRELVSLERDASAIEVDRLTAQLASFGDESPGENRDRRELRNLVRNQLGIAGRVRSRSEAVSQQRAHFFGMLRGLWTQLSEACDATGGDPSTIGQKAERVRSLCARIAADLQAPPASQDKSVP